MDLDCGGYGGGGSSGWRSFLTLVGPVERAVDHLWQKHERSLNRFLLPESRDSLHMPSPATLHTIKAIGLRGHSLLMHILCTGYLHGVRDFRRRAPPILRVIQCHGGILRRQ